MSTNDSANNSTPESEAGPAKREHIVKKAKSAKKADRTTRKADVIAVMKRAKGVTLAGGMKDTPLAAAQVRGFVNILGRKGAGSVKAMPQLEKPVKFNLIVMEFLKQQRSLTSERVH